MGSSPSAVRARSAVIVTSQIGKSNGENDRTKDTCNEKENSLVLERVPSATSKNASDNEENNTSSNETDTETLDWLLQNDIPKYKTACISYLQEMSKNITRIDINSDIGFLEAKTELTFVEKIGFVLTNKVPRLELETFTKDVAKVLIDTHIIDLISSVVTQYGDSTDLKQESLFTLALLILYNYTDCSDSFAAEVSKYEVLEICQKILETFIQQHIKGTLSEAEDRVVDYCHGLVHNVSMRDTNVERLRELNFIKVLQPYMKSHDDDIKMTCLTTLANLVTEEECDIIKTNLRSVSRLLDILDKGLDEKDRRYLGWSCLECAQAVRQLARSDANKQILWSLQAIPLLVCLTDTGDEDEQLEGVLAIWALAFDKDIREDITTNKETGVIEMLLKWKKSGKSRTLRDACERCLWILREELNDSPIKEYNDAVKEIKWKSQTTSKDTEKKGHIMISYQSRHRPTVKQICDALKDRKYIVWIDVDQMGGSSTLKAMADAIENACVVLICYSRNYKESQYCQSEAEYAYKLNKTIIPLKMEMGYTPNGWLGILLGEKYFVEFSGKYDFEVKIKKLFEEIDNVIAEHTKVSTDIPKPIVFETRNDVVVQKRDDVYAAPRSQVRNAIPDNNGVLRNLASVRQWTQTDVLNWLTKHDLKNQGLDKITGEEVSLLAKMHIEAPEILYECTKEELKLKTLLVKSRLVWALYDIANPL